MRIRTMGIYNNLSGDEELVGCLVDYCTGVLSTLKCYICRTLVSFLPRLLFSLLYASYEIFYLRNLELSFWWWSQAR